MIKFNLIISFLITLSLPFPVFAQSLPVPNSRTDLFFSSIEGYTDRTISGGYNVGFNYHCVGACSNLEFSDGKQWVSGDSQLVSGGSGCLTGVEPTGRHPYGSAFKVVLHNIDEQTDTAEVWRYLRYCVSCGCSPYNIKTDLMGIWGTNQSVFRGL